VADEPTGESDTATGVDILGLTTEIRRNRLVPVASHDELTLVTDEWG
jgi:ABC-type lipoprotein export system ATPase subunit